MNFLIVNSLVFRGEGVTEGGIFEFLELDLNVKDRVGCSLLPEHSATCPRYLIVWIFLS